MQILPGGIGLGTKPALDEDVKGAALHRDGSDTGLTIADALGSARVLDMAWSRHPERRIGFDGSGCDELIDSLEQLALDAGLIAMARIETTGASS